jgi:hypothetical protein
MSDPEQNAKRKTRRGLAPTIIKLKVKHPNMTERAIAKHVGCHPANVHQVLSKYLGKSSHSDLQQYQSAKAEVFDAVAMRLVESITPRKIAKAQLLPTVTSIAILEDKSRVIRGQATTINVSVVADLAEAIRSQRDGIRGIQQAQADANDSVVSG